MKLAVAALTALAFAAPISASTAPERIAGAIALAPAPSAPCFQTNVSRLPVLETPDKSHFVVVVSNACFPASDLQGSIVFSVDGLTVATIALDSQDRATLPLALQTGSVHELCVDYKQPDLRKPRLSAVSYHHCRQLAP